MKFKEQKQKHICSKQGYKEEIEIIYSKETINGYKWKLSYNQEPGMPWVNFNISYCPFCGVELNTLFQLPPTTKPVEIELKYKTDDRIKIHKLETRKGIFVSDELWNNRKIGYATLITWVPGHGGDVWRAKNDDDSQAVYSTTEFTVVAEPEEITDDTEAELITGALDPAKGSFDPVVEMLYPGAKTTIIDTLPPTESVFRKEYQNNPIVEEKIAIDEIKENLARGSQIGKPKGQYLQIMVCPDKLRGMPHPNIGSDTIERVLDRAINTVFRDVFGANVTIRFYWKDRYTAVSPCGKDIKWDDSEFMPKFRAHGTAEVKEELADGTVVLKGVNLTHITIDDHPAKIVPTGSFKMEIHKEKSKEKIHCSTCDHRNKVSPNIMVCYHPEFEENRALPHLPLDESQYPPDWCPLKKDKVSTDLPPPDGFDQL